MAEEHCFCLGVCGLFLWVPKFREQPFGDWVIVVVQSGRQWLFSAIPYASFKGTSLSLMTQVEQRKATDAQTAQQL